MANNGSQEKLLHNQSDDEKEEYDFRQPKLKCRRTKKLLELSDSESETDISLEPGFDEIDSEFTESSTLSIEPRPNFRPMRGASQLNMHISNLPDDILLAIFLFLPLCDRLKRVALVCSAWNVFACDPYLWHDCEFNAENKLSDVILQRVVSYSGNVKKLALDNCQMLTDVGLKHALVKCSHLRKLSITAYVFFYN